MKQTTKKAKKTLKRSSAKRVSGVSKKGSKKVSETSLKTRSNGIARGAQSDIPAEKPEKKDNIYFKVLNAAIQLDFMRGHLKWSMSELSRKSKVSRTLIYYYFGKSKSGILYEAIRLFGTEIAGFNERKIAYWLEGKSALALVENRELVAKIPQIVPLYFMYRGKDNDIGKMIRETEAKYMEKIRQFHPEKSDDDVKAIFAFLIGLLFSPHMTEDTISVGLGYFQKPGQKPGQPDIQKLR